MDGSFDFRWPISPFAAVAALGAALISLCFAIWNRNPTDEENEEFPEEPIRQEPRLDIQELNLNVQEPRAELAPVIRVRDLQLRFPSELIRDLQQRRAGLQGTRSDNEQSYLVSKNDSQEPLVDLRQPVVDLQGPIIETQAPILNLQEPTVHLQDNIVERQVSNIEIQEFNVELQEPRVDLQASRVNGEQPIVDDQPQDLKKHQVVELTELRPQLQELLIESQQPSIHLQALHNKHEEPREESQKSQDSKASLAKIDDQSIDDLREDRVVELTELRSQLKEPLVKSQAPSVHLQALHTGREEPRDESQKSQDSKTSLAKSDTFAPVIKLRDLELRWGDGTGPYSQLLPPSAALRSSFTDNRDASSSAATAAEALEFECRWLSSTNSECRGDNGLDGHGGRSTGVIRQEFGSVVGSSSSGSDPQQLSISPGRILDGYFRRRAQSGSGDRISASPNSFFKTGAHVEGHSDSKTFGSLPDVALSAMLTDVESGKKGEKLSIRNGKCDEDAEYDSSLTDEEDVLSTDKYDQISNETVEENGKLRTEYLTDTNNTPDVKQNDNLTDKLNGNCDKTLPKYSSIINEIEMQQEDFDDPNVNENRKTLSCLKTDNLTGSDNHSDGEVSECASNKDKSCHKYNSAASKKEMHHTDDSSDTSHTKSNHLNSDNLEIKSSSEPVVAHNKAVNANVNNSIHSGQLPVTPPIGAIQKFETDDALIACSCLIDAIAADGIGTCASDGLELSRGMGSGDAASPVATMEHLEEQGRAGQAKNKKNNDIAVEEASGPITTEPGSQVDHLALEQGCWQSHRSVTTEKGAGGAEGGGPPDVTRSRDGTLWGRGTASGESVVVPDPPMEEVLSADPLEAIVRDLRGICDGLSASNRDVPSRITNGKGCPSGAVESSKKRSPSVIEVTSVSECFFKDSGVIESTLNFETALRSLEELGSVHRVSSVFNGSNGEELRLSHRIESSRSNGLIQKTQPVESSESDGLIEKSQLIDSSSSCSRASGLQTEAWLNSLEDLTSVHQVSSVFSGGEDVQLSHRVQSSSTPDGLLKPEGGVSGGLLPASNDGNRVPGSPVKRLMGLLDRDQERRARAKSVTKVVNGDDKNGIASREEQNARNGVHPKNDRTTAGAGKDAGPSTGAGEEQGGGGGGGEAWDALMRDVLASVSELERFEREAAAGRRCDRGFPSAASPHSAPGGRCMESPPLPPPALKEPATTPTKVKNLRFKLDPDVYDVPSDDSFYDDDDNDDRRTCKPNWRRHQQQHHASKYQTFSALELDSEPVRLVSVRTSVVQQPAKTLVVRPPRQLDIDLRISLESGDNKRGCPVPAQAKRKSPVVDGRTGWCQELSPVSENVDWRETLGGIEVVDASPKGKPNGILKQSPKVEVQVDRSNPFKAENGDAPKDAGAQNGVLSPQKLTPLKPIQNGNAPPRKLFLPRKKFVPDPEAIERITGYKVALTKPPLPPPPVNRGSPSPRLGGTAKKRTESARKQYFDHKAALANAKAQESSSQKFQQFLAQAQNDRARIVTSSPDLGAIEQAVMTQWLKEKAALELDTSSEQLDVSREGTPSRSSTPDDVWTGYVQMCRRHLNRRSRSLCYLETDIDAMMVVEDKAISLTALNEPPEPSTRLEPKDPGLEESTEDLVDSGHAKSEHEIRVERSLRNLSLPDWYRNCEKPKTGFLLGSGNAKEKKGWAAAKSLASSTSSLTSCGVRRPRPIRSLRSSQENIPWSRGSVSPAESELSRNGPALSLALARAFREPYLGWRARTPSSGVSSSPQVDLSPPSWVADSCDTPLTSDLPPMNEEDVSFDGEDVILVTSSEEPHTDGDTCEDVVTMSMDTCKDLPGEDTCDDINNMSMDTCELFPPPSGEQKSSPLADDTCDDVRNISSDTAAHNGHPSPLNTGDDINNLSTDASESQDDSSVRNGDSSSMYQQRLKSHDASPVRNGGSSSAYHDRVKSQDNSPSRNGLSSSTHSHRVRSEDSSPVRNGSSSLMHYNQKVKSHDDCSVRNGGSSSAALSHQVRSEDSSPVRNGSSSLMHQHQKVKSQDDCSVRNGDSSPVHHQKSKRGDMKRKRYSYSQSIYHSEWDEEAEGKKESTTRESSPANKIIWIESSFVGSRTTTSIVVLPTQNDDQEQTGNGLVRPASR